MAYCLIAEEDIDVGHDLHQVVLEELADEGGGEIHAEQLVAFRRVLRHLQDGLQGDGQEETLRGTKTSNVLLLTSGVSEQHTVMVSGRK